MNFNVPQFIEVEDKIAFQMTAKQLGWYALGGIVLFVLWRVIENKVVFIGVGIVVAIISTGFAFFRPAGMSLMGFFINGFNFMVRPKIMIWQRKTANQEIKKRERKNDEIEMQRKGNRFAKEKALKETNSLADILDKQSKI